MLLFTGFLNLLPQRYKKLPDSVSCDQYKVTALSLVGADPYAQYQ